MQIIEKKIEEIKPYEKNARRNRRAISAVAESIKQFGFKNPIVIDKDGVIVCGHTRYKAAKRLKYKTVPCIMADDLTEEQIKAFRLADNKTGEIADWDYDKLEEEMASLEVEGFDWDAFGFDKETQEAEKQEQNERCAVWNEANHKRMVNILNLEKAQYTGVGKYDIPEILPVYDLPEIRGWLPFDYMLQDKEPEGKAIHFFINDFKFERIFNNPDKYIDRLKRYVCVASPDFSPYGDMPLATQIYNHYRKHWVGRYLQEHGVTVIPTIRASTDPRSLEWFLEGEPHNSIVIISSMWTNNKAMQQAAETEYNMMKEVLQPSKIFIYGEKTKYMGISEEDNIEYVKSISQVMWGKKE